MICIKVTKKIQKPKKTKFWTFKQGRRQVFWESTPAVGQKKNWGMP